MPSRPATSWRFCRRPSSRSTPALPRWSDMAAAAAAVATAVTVDAAAAAAAATVEVRLVCVPRTIVTMFLTTAAGSGGGANALPINNRRW